MTDIAPPKAGRREWVALAVLTLPTLLVTMDLNVLFLALPHIAADLHAGPVQQLWITDIYGFIVAGLTVTMGVVGDRYGRKRILLGSGILFMAASLLCTFASSVAMLIVGRALLGFAGAALVPLTLALIIGMFKDPRQMGTALGVWASALGAGAVLGPPIGGIVLHSFWWGSVFLIAVPIMAVLLVVGPAVLDESRNPDAGKIDLLSVSLFLVSILPLVGALKEIARGTFGVTTAGLLVLGIVGTTLFVRRQNRIPNPLIDLSLFKDKVVRSGMSVFIVTALLAGAIGLIVALYLQLVDGLSVLAAGLWMLPAALIGLAFSNVAPKLAGKYKPAAVIAGGMLIAGVGAVVLVFVGPTGGLAVAVVGLAICMIGTSPVGPVANQVVMMNTPPEKAGGVGGLTSTSGELGAALGIAVLGSVATAVYRGGIEVPAGTPANLVGQASDSISGAVAAAGTMPAGPVRDGLLAAANDAFMSGFSTVAVIAAAGFAVVATIAWRGMRHIAPAGAGHGGGEEAPSEAPEPTGEADRTAA